MSDLKTQYKFIHFEITEHKAKTDVWEIHNNKSNDWLGTIEWGSWRKYIVTQFNSIAEFSDDCLDDISTFLKHLNILHRKINT